MEDTSLFVICTAVVLAASTVTSLITLWNTMIKKPADKIKEKHEGDLKEKISETLKEVLPLILETHDIETRDKYRADRERYLNEIKASVLMDTKNELNQVQALKLQYESLVISAKDVLREKISKIYISNKDDKTLTVLEREKLDQFYKDYKALNGNSYIDKYYTRMSKWTVIDDDYDDDGEFL